mgnify:FL=1
MLAETLLVARKDLRVEWRAKIALGQVAPLALLILVVLAFALDANSSLLELGAGGLYWVAVLYGGTLLIQRSFDVETDDGNMDALRMSAIGASSLFLGKSLALFVQIGLLELVLGSGIAVLYNVRVADWGLLLVAAASGTVAFSVLSLIHI